MVVKRCVGILLFVDPLLLIGCSKGELFVWLCYLRPHNKKKTHPHCSTTLPPHEDHTEVWFFHWNLSTLNTLAHRLVWSDSRNGSPKDVVIWALLPNPQCRERNCTGVYLMRWSKTSSGWAAVHSWGFGCFGATSKNPVLWLHILVPSEYVLPQEYNRYACHDKMITSILALLEWKQGQ